MRAIHSPNPWFYFSSIAESCDQMEKGEEDTNNHSQEACREGPRFEYIIENDKITIKEDF